MDKIKKKIRNYFFFFVYLRENYSRRVCKSTNKKIPALLSMQRVQADNFVFVSVVFVMSFLINRCDTYRVRKIKVDEMFMIVSIYILYIIGPPFQIPGFKCGFCRIFVLKQGNPSSEFVVANTLAKWKKLEPHEIDFSQGFSQKVVSKIVMYLTLCQLVATFVIC